MNPYLLFQEMNTAVHQKPQGLSPVTHPLNCLFFLFLFLANLTGHAEKVGIENFELLKVLGTGGKSLS